MVPVPIFPLTDSNDNDFSMTPNLGVMEQEARILFPVVILTGAAILHEAYLEAY
ncbi:MAG: hypothetical protein ABIC40_03020 [bacterium]